MRSQLGNVIPLWSSVILLLNVVHFLHHAADWQIFEHLSYKHISGVQDYKVILSDLLMVITIMWLLRGNFQTTNQINKLDKPIRSSKVKRSGRRKKMKRDRFQLSSLPCKTPTGKNEAKPFFEKRILVVSYKDGASKSITVYFTEVFLDKHSSASKSNNKNEGNTKSDGKCQSVVCNNYHQERKEQEVDLETENTQKLPKNMDFPKKNDSDQRSTEYFLHDDIHQKNENPPTEHIQRESYRLSTFQHFPASVPIDARQFAAAGFYFTGSFDEVKCFACSNPLRNISSDTDPFLFKMHRPTCQFARQQDDCGNQPLQVMTGSDCKWVEPQRNTLVSSNVSGHPSHQGVQTLPSFSNQFSGCSATSLHPTDRANTATSRRGLDTRNVQAATTVSPQASTNNIPIHRQLATISNPDQSRLIRSLNLRRESHRFQTFTAEWPSDSAPPAEDMATSGWFYLGNLDRTQCFCCGGVLRNWRRLDNPNTEHITHFPHCQMACGQESQNISDMDRQRLQPMAIFPNQLNDQQRRDLRIMFPCDFPVTSSMNAVGDRKRTFNNWHFTRAAPQMLAEAGFFSLGTRDRVKCFYCNGGLQNWRQNDNPWEEHAKWYPTCEFLLQQRGPEFVHNVVARFPNLSRPSARSPGQDVPPRSQAPREPERPLQPPLQRQAEPVAAQCEPRSLLERALQSEIAATVLGLGFDESLIRDVMQRHIKQHGVGFQSSVALLEAVNEAETLLEAEESTSTESSLTERNPGDSLSANEEQVDEHEQIFRDMCSLADVRSYSLNNAAGNSKGLEEKLKAELRELEDERLCKVCLDRAADMVFIPCSHICCCLECTKALKMCPICRQQIAQAVRTYKS